MNEFRLFSQWLWSRPLIKSLNYRPPIPRIFWNLVSYLCFLVVGYSSLKLFAPQPEKEKLESSYHNVWILLAIGLFFCGVATNGYLDKRFPSTKVGVLAQFNPGKRLQQSAREAQSRGRNSLLGFVHGWVTTNLGEALERNNLG